MLKLIRSIALLCALALFAAACGGGEDEVADDVSSAEEVEQTSTTTTAAPETTTTEATTTEATTTTTEAPSGPAFPLSGVVIPDDATSDHPAVVVKISNNDTTARAALLGLNEADVVFEERIEQQATRFAAVFHSSLPTEVGSVRSARTSDIDIIANLNRPVFAFSGANDGVNAQVRQAENEGLLVRASNELADPQFRRISEFRAPNNLVVDTVGLLDKATDSDAPTPIFDFSDNVVELGTASPGARVEARSEAIFVWSETAGGYLRFENGQQLVGRNGAPLVSQNVVVMTTTYVPSQIDAQSRDAITVGSNPVTIYANGSRVEGTWTREFTRDGYTFETPDGQTIGLAPGQTWVSLAPAGTSVELGQLGATALLNR